MQPICLLERHLPVTLRGNLEGVVVRHRGLVGTVDLRAHNLLTSSLVRYFYLPHDGTHDFKGVSEDLTGDAG